MKLVRTWMESTYRVLGTSLMILRANGGWRIRMQPYSIGIPTIAQNQWGARNLELTEMSFSTLREAREYLQALLAVDPFPDPAIPLAKLKRNQDGTYQVTIQSGRGVVHRGEARRETGGWALYSQGEHLGRFASLSELRCRAGVVSKDLIRPNAD